jgi:hypothetical protein
MNNHIKPKQHSRWHGFSHALRAEQQKEAAPESIVARAASGTQRKR